MAGGDQGEVSSSCVRADEIEEDDKMKGGDEMAGGEGEASSSYVRADEIEMGELDVHMDRLQLSRALEKKKQQQPPSMEKEEWELVDLAEALKIGEVVARGEFGAVYRATYHGQHVAAKQLSWGEDISDSQVAVLRASLMQELAVWHQLSHPNVAKFIGASMDATYLNVLIDDSNIRAEHPERECCVVVEYLGGGTLRDFLKENSETKLSYETVVQIALEMARGLAYLHFKKIVHRNVKPKNMLLTDQGSIKIADFGLARVEAQNQEEMTGMTGTPAYMAPEVFQGKPYNRKCDVYSFGISLWEIYCCDLPYPNMSMTDVSYAVVHQNVRPKIPRCCPEAMSTIMKRCWDANPNDRPEMGEVVSLLESLDTSNGGGMIPKGQPAGCFCFFK